MHYYKLSLKEGDFNIDSDNNICKSIIICDDDDNDETDNFIPTYYCFDYANFDDPIEVFFLLDLL